MLCALQDAFHALGYQGGLSQAALLFLQQVLVNIDFAAYSPNEHGNLPRIAPISPIQIPELGSLVELVAELDFDLSWSGIMKLAVLADIHGNLPALQTVASHIDRWQPDKVVVAGDIVNRGPQPLVCLQFVKERERHDGWLLLRGNHEEYVIHQSTPDAPRIGSMAEIFLSAYWTLQRLEGDVESLVSMPFQQSIIGPESGEARITHASMRGTRDGIFPQTPDHVLQKQVGRPVVPLFCVGHTHWPLIRRLRQTLVVNVGAVGLPFDGDARASYGQMEWRNGQWQARIVRLAYDRGQAEQDFLTSGFIGEGGPLARLMLLELQTARSHLYQWSMAYEQAVVAGELTLAESVAAYLDDFSDSAPMGSK